MTEQNQFIYPDWPAPSHIHAFTTTRQGGLSNPPYDSFNLGDHVADDLETVKKNREILVHNAQLPTTPFWLSQVHGTEVISSTEWRPGIEADAITSNQVNEVCAILTADCLPLLLCNEAGTQVAAIHAGWRGLVNGIIENTVAQFRCDPEQILVWLGPAIGPHQFEVGMDVYTAFIAANADAKQAFSPRENQHFLADIYLLAKQRLHSIGVTKIYGGEHCTVSDSEQFFSYRRDGKTGRMVSIIWMDHK